MAQQYRSPYKDETNFDLCDQMKSSIDKVNKIERILFDGYLRMTVQNKLSKQVSQLMTVDVIKLCNLFYTVKLEHIMKQCRLELVEEEGEDWVKEDKNRAIMRTIDRFFDQFCTNEEYFIPFKLCQKLVDDAYFEQHRGLYHYFLAILLFRWNTTTTTTAISDEDISCQIINEYQKAIELKPNDALIKWDYASTLLAMQKYELALVQWMQCLQVITDVASVKYKIGLCYHGLQNDDDAIKYFKQCVETNPSYDPSMNKNDLKRIFKRIDVKQKYPQIMAGFIKS